MDSRDHHSKQNDKYKLDPKKIKKLQHKFQSSLYYSRSAYNKIFQELAAQELKKHKAEHDRTRLPNARNAQITLAEDAFVLLNKAKINDEEYAEFLYELHSQYSQYKKIQVTKPEFEKVLPQLIREWPAAEKLLINIMSDWAELEYDLEEAEKKLEDSEGFYKDAIRKLADGEKRPTITQKDLKALRDDKRLKEKEYYQDKSEADKWKFREARFQHLDFTKAQAQDLNERNLQSSKASFTSAYDRMHDRITHALNTMVQAKKPQVDAKKSEETIKKEIASTEKSFAEVFRFSSNKADLNFLYEDNRQLFSQRVLAKVLNNRVLEKFERKKDQTFAGALLYIQKILILHDEYNNDEDAAAGNTYLGKIKDIGSRLYRGIFNVLDNRKVTDGDFASRMYKHPHLSERAQQKCLALFRDFAVHNEELFKRIAYREGSREKFIDGKKVGKDIPYWKNSLAFGEDGAGKPKLKKVSRDYEKNTKPKLVRDSKNVSDFMDKAVDKLTAYERVGKGKWKPSTRKTLEIMEADRQLKIYDKYVASFRNIPREHTLHTKLNPPEHKNLLKPYNDLEVLRRKFEESELVKPFDVINEKERLNTTTGIVHFSKLLKDARSRILSSRKYPAEGAHQAASDDMYKRARDMTLSRIRLETCLRIMPGLPDKFNTDEFTDTYIFSKKSSRLYYVRNGKPEVVRIIDHDKFKQSLIEVMKNDELKFLTAKQVNDLITSNGGHTGSLRKIHAIGPKAGHVIMDPEKVRKAKEFGDRKAAAAVGPAPRLK